MDIWALLTGVLTIISFLLVYADRFPKYTGTFKALMAFFRGFAVSACCSLICPLLDAQVSFRSGR